MNLLDIPKQWRRCSPTRWYVIFCDADRRHWWDVLWHTRPGFSHVYALRWDGWNWICVNPGVCFTEIAILPGTTENALRGFLPANATVIEVEAFRQGDRIRGRWWIGPMTCVEQIKALLGLPVGRIVTPWQLYRYLTGDHSDGRIRFRQDFTVNLRQGRSEKDDRTVAEEPESV